MLNAKLKKKVNKRKKKKKKVEFLTSRKNIKHSFLGFPTISDEVFRAEKFKDHKKSMTNVTLISRVSFIVFSNGREL